MNCHQPVDELLERDPVYMQLFLITVDESTHNLYNERNTYVLSGSYVRGDLSSFFSRELCYFEVDDCEP